MRLLLFCIPLLWCLHIQRYDVILRSIRFNKCPRAPQTRRIPEVLSYVKICNTHNILSKVAFIGSSGCTYIVASKYKSYTNNNVAVSQTVEVCRTFFLIFPLKYEEFIKVFIINIDNKFHLFDLSTYFYYGGS